LKHEYLKEKIGNIIISLLNLMAKALLFWESSSLISASSPTF
jgi:hypothetical protein